MNVMLRRAAAIFFALHGLIHVMGFVAAWQLATLPEIAYRTTAATTVTNLDHATITLEDAASRRFLKLLDGSRTHDDLGDAVIADGHAPEDAPGLVAKQLNGLGRLGLLIT